LSMATGVSQHAARKVIERYNATWDPTRKVTSWTNPNVNKNWNIFRPKKKLLKTSTLSA
jgi:hypothetical protein